VYKRLGRCVIAVSEGITLADGTPVAVKLAETQGTAVEKDAHGNVQLSGSGALADALAAEIKSKLKIKRVRADTFGYLQRSFAGLVSKVDAAEARASGKLAAKMALAGKFPGATLGEALDQPVMLGDGGKDLYIQQARFHQQFAADVPKAAATMMAATQRPVAQAALTEATGVAAWKTVPSYWIYGTADRNIPPAAMEFMAERAQSRNTVTIDGASHVVMVSHPKQVALLIKDAAGAK
jgi:pimeloyl-ACP methyl ester carboxylesterase